ncbi:MAG TPA: hypothetical protein VF069_23705 [Streptosporangiaceae bacterium]
MAWATANDGGGRSGGAHLRRMSPRRTAARRADVEQVLWLARLRRDFPDWAFLFDPWACVWVAVQGRYRIEMAATANALHESLRNQRAGRTEK